MLKKFILILLIALGFGFLSTDRVFANVVDVSLLDKPEEGVVSVLMNSYEEYIPGVDMQVIFSENIVIQDITAGEYCNIAFNASVSDNKLSIECFNDLDVTMDGVLASIMYTTDEEDYYFYINEQGVDIGEATLGSVENINKPESVQREEEIQEQEQIQYTTTDRIVDFLRDNSLYILIGVITVVAILFTVFVWKPKREDTITN
jgi:hypothetical protein